jgi:PASTA domain-containing protein
MSLFAPQAPEKTDPPVPPVPPERPRRGLFGWVQRKPRTAFWSTLLIALFVGMGIGGAASSQQTELDAANSRADRAEARADRAEQRNDDLDGELTESREQASELSDQVKTLSAKGEVPSFTGQDISEARDNDAVQAYDWQVKTVSQISGESPGTVLAQQPTEGRTLKAGRSITLTIAKKAPPKPKQWVTVKSLSGASSTKTPEFSVPEGAKARLLYDMSQDGNNAIILYKAPDEYIDLLLNEIGPQNGSTRLYNHGTYYLDVTGAYEIQLQVFKRP